MHLCSVSDKNSIISKSAKRKLRYGELILAWNDLRRDKYVNHNICNFLDCDWLKGAQSQLRSFPCFALRIHTAHNLWRHQRALVH